ncbi:MAG: hypothetical protein P4M10_05990 [Verrucomicrobiae bacterium]|nr:hypothetical protein [Verrucomicrobiae bacterium]
MALLVYPKGFGVFVIVVWQQFWRSGPLIGEVHPAFCDEMREIRPVFMGLSSGLIGFATA